MALNILLIIFSFTLIWFASKLIIKTASDLSHLLRLSAFATSFFVLGLSTSMPETFISIASALDKHPEIFVGTLLGGSIVVFLFVVPILAILGKGITITHSFHPKTLAFSLFVIILPFIGGLDGKLERKEGIIMIIAYLMLLYLIEKHQGLFRKMEEGFMKERKAELLDLGKIIFAAAVLLVSSQILVTNTVLIANAWQISPFIISILLLSLGTDLPETSIAIVSSFKKEKSIALGDYIGSAAANTLGLGILTLAYGNFRFTDSSFLITTCLFSLSLFLFFLFARSKNTLSRKEGALLLLMYFSFILIKIIS